MAHLIAETVLVGIGPKVHERERVVVQFAERFGRVGAVREEVSAHCGGRGDDHLVHVERFAVGFEDERPIHISLFYGFR